MTMNVSAAVERGLKPLVGPDAELIEHQQVAWASVTFRGSRHTVKYRFTGQAVGIGELFAAELAEHEFNIPGHLVADATVTGCGSWACLPEPVLEVQAELLLLEDAAQ